jgi:hypothetical protein
MNTSNTKTKIQEFNSRNSLYQILYNYIKKNLKEFQSQKTSDLTKGNVKRYIEVYGILLNKNCKIRKPNAKIADGDFIEIPELDIQFGCIKNSKYSDIDEEDIVNNQSDIKTSNPSEYEEKSEYNNQISKDIDDFIIKYLQVNLDVSAIDEIAHTDIKKTFCVITSLFQEKGFDKIKKSNYSYLLTSYIKDKIESSNLIKEIGFTKSHLSFAGKTIEILITTKINKEKEFEQIIEHLKNGYFPNPFRFLQEYNKLFSTSSFQYLIAPLLETKLSDKIIIESLLKPIIEALKLTEIEDKFLHYEKNISIYNNYIGLIKEYNTYNKDFFEPIANYLFNQFKRYCETDVEKSANIEVLGSKRKYNFTNKERTDQFIILNISNDGEGLARSISINSESEYFNFNLYNVGILKPEENRELRIPVNVVYTAAFKPSIEIRVSWEEISGKIFGKRFIVDLLLQEGDVPWEDLRKQNPYSNKIIDKEKNLYGRDDIIEELTTNLLSENIESYKIWGQKRVGKSSIVKTLQSKFIIYEKTIVAFRSIGGIRSTEPINTLNDLGESLCSEIFVEINKKIIDLSLKERLLSIPVPEFNGSLNPLEKYIRKLKQVDNSLKFVLILDEFDRINEEFFLPGNLGETLSLSIGKGLNEYDYIAFILVGSENMHLLDRQGINYNSYHEKEVSTFDKKSEYSFFQKIITAPVENYIQYTDRAIERIYEITNGNPYFAKLICTNIFKQAFKNRDTEIDYHSVNNSIKLIVNSFQKSHFEHFWSDGITEETNVRKEKKSDIRRRVLVSFSMSSINDNFPQKNDILKSFKYPDEYKIEKFEVENAITEFFNRRIFVEDKGKQIRIIPNLFEQWLIGPGKSLMIEGVSDLEALHREKELDYKLSVKDEELKRLRENYKFKNKIIPIEQFRNYLAQFGIHSEQRKIFKLLDQIYYISQEEINDFFRTAQNQIFISKELNIKSNVKTLKREGIELYCFSETLSENEELARSFKIISRIKTTKKTKDLKTDKNAWEKSKSDQIIIIESIIDDAFDIAVELKEFLEYIEETEEKVSVKIVTLIITTKAKASIIKILSQFDNIQIVSFHEVDDELLKPFQEGSVLFENNDEANKSFAVVRKIFPLTGRKSLLVLFENLCPSRSCDILWRKTKQFDPIFPNDEASELIVKNLEPQETSEQEKESLRTRLYHANRELSQKLNKYICNYLKANAGERDWFTVEYIPKKVVENIHTRWIQEDQKLPKESYFDFLDYKKIIEKHESLRNIFNIPGEGFSWLDKLNELRRDPAHPEKPAPALKDVEFYEKIKGKVILIIDQN